MNSFHLLSGLILIVSFMVMGCDNSNSTTERASPVSAKEVKEEIEEALETTQDFTESQLDEFEKKVDTK